MALSSTSRSTLVFALITCVPFGLAIKDTFGDQPRHERHGDDELGDGDGDGDGDYEADLRRIEEHRREQAAEEAATEARQQAEAAAKRAKLRTLYGAEPATLGPAVGMVALGAGSSVATASARLASEDYGVEVTPHGEHALLGISLDSGAREVCRELEDDLQQVWSAGEVGTRGRYWINGTLDQRAALKKLSSNCELRIEKFAPPAAWIDRTKAAVVPLWAIGRSAKELTAHLEARPSVAELDDGVTGEITWVDYGLGPTGRGFTDLTANVQNGKVLGLTASAEVEVDTHDALASHMTKLFGAATDDDTMVWKRAKPRLELELSAGKVYLHAGKPPE